jgi:N-acetylglutamate synthase-like GNAT family acetyltransferase
MPASPEIKLRRGRPAEAETLTELAMRSKAHWGYDDAFMAMCRAELTIAEERIAEATVIVAERGGRTVGFGGLSVTEGAAGEIWDIFVEPAEIGRGIGNSIMLELIRHAREAGARRLVVDADPHARGFYEKLGFRFSRDVPSGSIPGRTLPQLTLDV